MPQIRRVGHRGAGGLEPQNTIRSFERAIALGVDMVETDVRQSRDGALVLAHDEEIRRSRASAQGAAERVVAEHDLETLRSVDLGHGERIPTLAEALEVVRGRCGLMIDLKGEGFEAETVAAIQASGLPCDQVVVPGGSEHSRARLRHLDPNIPLSLSLDVEWDDRITPEFIARIDTDAVTWHHRLITPERVARLHDRGLFVYTWTVDDLDTMRRMIAAGVDGIITNRPSLFAQL
jgi:glycerophosphoryl diester phosphodiesterase